MIKTFINNESGKFYEVQQWMTQNFGKGVKKNINNKRATKKWSMKYAESTDPVTKVISFHIQISCKDPAIALMAKLRWHGC